MKNHNHNFRGNYPPEEPYLSFMQRIELNTPNSQTTGLQK